MEGETHCPTCGQQCSKAIPEGLSESAVDLKKVFEKRGVHLTLLQAKLICVLKNKNRPVSYNLIMETIYGFRPDGDYPLHKTLHVVASVARRKIKKSGLDWDLKVVWGYGYELEER